MCRISIESQQDIVQYSKESVGQSNSSSGGREGKTLPSYTTITQLRSRSPYYLSDCSCPPPRFANKPLSGRNGDHRANPQKAERLKIVVRLYGFKLLMSWWTGFAGVGVQDGTPLPLWKIRSRAWTLDK